MNPKLYQTAVLLSLTLLFSCKKDNTNSSKNTFTITTSSGKTYTTSYTATPSQAENVFQLDYNYDDTDNLVNLNFVVLIDQYNSYAGLSTYEPGYVTGHMIVLL